MQVKINLLFYGAFRTIFLLLLLWMPNPQGYPAQLLKLLKMGKIMKIVLLWHHVASFMAMKIPSKMFNFLLPGNLMPYAQLEV